MSLADRVAQWWQETPWAPPLAAGVAVAVAALVVFGLWPTTAGSAPEQSLPRVSAPTVPITEAEIVVHVSGRVVTPGVYRLTPGARIVDLIDLAGGLAPSAEPDALNLASMLRDGDRVHVPSTAELSDPSRSPPIGAATSASDSDGLVDVNSASADQLESLPGIGPATAQAILADRDENGPFSSVDDLDRVAGIGPKTVEALRDLVDTR